MSVADEIAAILRAQYFDGGEVEAWFAENHGNTDRAFPRLKLSHTRRFFRSEIDYYHLLDAYAALPSFRGTLRTAFPDGISYAGIGILVREVDRRSFVASVARGAPADVAGVHVGDELVAVSGRAYEQIIPFVRSEGRQTSLTIRRSEGGSQMDLTVRPRKLRPAFLLANATRGSFRLLSSGERRVGYVRPWSLAGDRQWKTLVTVLTDRLQECDALLLDLRGGIGGASPSYVDFFAGRSPELQVRRRDSMVPTIVNPRWRKPLAVLVDETTRSGSEVLAFGLQNAGIPLVGARTAGDVSSAAPYLLSDGSFLTVAVGWVEVDRVVLEGRGVKPDVEQLFDFRYSAGNDPVVDRALKILEL